MKEYKFERIKLSGVKGFSSKPQEDYQEVIKNNAKKGWELVQIFSPGNSLYGSASYIEIIFVRDKKM